MVFVALTEAILPDTGSLAARSVSATIHSHLRPGSGAAVKELHSNGHNKDV